MPNWTLSASNYSEGHALRTASHKETAWWRKMWSAVTVERVCFLAFGSSELMVGVTRIPDLENAVEKVYKQENRANLFVFNLWDRRQEEGTGS